MRIGVSSVSIDPVEEDITRTSSGSPSECLEWQPRRTRIATLDGWRGVAILMVIMTHGFELMPVHTKLFANVGGLGVDIFFVISGYVITLSALREYERGGTISLGNFYQRRAFRILPVALCYLLVLSIASTYIHLLDPTKHEVLASLFFWRNYWQVRHPFLGIYTGQYWSLSVEEHFYLLWPTLLCLAGKRRAMALALAGTAACAGWRYFHYIYCNQPFMAMRTDLRFDGLLLGCSLALFLRNADAREFILRNFPKETPVLCALPGLLWYQHMAGEPSLLTYLLITCALASTVVVEEGVVYRWLNSRVLVWIGTVSYSLYIWQQLFMRHVPGETPLGWAQKLPINLVVTFAVAAGSYYFLERPAQRLGRKLAGGIGNEAMVHHVAVPLT